MEDKEKVVGEILLDKTFFSDFDGMPLLIVNESIVKTLIGIGRVKKIVENFRPELEKVEIELKMLDGSKAGKIVRVKLTDVTAVILSFPREEYENR